MTKRDGGVRVNRIDDGCAWRIWARREAVSESLGAVEPAREREGEGGKGSTHSSFSDRAVRPVRLQNRRVAEVAAREAPPDARVVLAARHNRDLEPLEVLGELGPDRQGAREGAEVEAVLRERTEEGVRSRREGKRASRDAPCGTTCSIFDRLRGHARSARCLSPARPRSRARRRTLDERVVRVERRQVIALLDRELAPLELGADRVAVTDEDVLRAAERGGQSLSRGKTRETGAPGPRSWTQS